MFSYRVAFFFQQLWPPTIGMIDYLVANFKAKNAKQFQMILRCENLKPFHCFQDKKNKTNEEIIGRSIDTENHH